MPHADGISWYSICSRLNLQQTDAALYSTIPKIMVQYWFYNIGYITISRARDANLSKFSMVWRQEKSPPSYFSSINIIRICRNQVKSEPTLKTRENKFCERQSMETSKVVNNSAFIFVQFSSSTLNSREK